LRLEPHYYREAKIRLTPNKTFLPDNLPGKAQSGSAINRSLQVHHPARQRPGGDGGSRCGGAKSALNCLSADSGKTEAKRLHRAAS
jgi:hypothetical protein